MVRLWPRRAAIATVNVVRSEAPMDAILNCSSVIFGFLSGALWLVAALMKVPTNLSSGFGGTVTGLDAMAAGFRRQAIWNGAAAGATALAALLQAAHLLLVKSS
jgi:hypothetical protein